jgi:hypothetical protein
MVGAGRLSPQLSFRTSEAVRLTAVGLPCLSCFSVSTGSLLFSSLSVDVAQCGRSSVTEQDRVSLFCLASFSYVTVPRWPHRWSQEGGADLIALPLVVRESLCDDLCDWLGGPFCPFNCLNCRWNGLSYVNCVAIGFGSPCSRKVVSVM